MKKQLHFIGYASGAAAGNTGCKDGPKDFQKAACLKKMALEGIEIKWHAVLEPNMALTDKYELVGQINTQLAELTFQLNHQGEKFIVVGGDHSSGIGTWSGAHRALQQQGNLGLIWVDAHMDAHTNETTPSGNIHGMPVAALLGYGDKRLTQIGHALPKLRPQHVCLVGIRSYEAGEKALLEKLGIKVFYADEVKARGLSAVFADALKIVNQNTAGFGISIDLDGLDPDYTPGVGTPVSGGIRLEDMCVELHKLTNNERCVGLEIAEYNPHECPDGRTQQAICKLVAAWAGGR